jgi:basic membrane lipoprotein Med (substrate-binding protein (PBP1-ABC) superfamily)
VSNQETKTPAEYDEAFRAYASQGYGLIFAHGFEYQDAALRAGPAYPDARIVISGGDTVTSNVIPLIFSLEDAAYLAGVAAAGMSKSGILGMVGGVQIPSAEDVARAFEAGAKSVDPKVRVLETWIGSWDDLSAAKEAAVAQIRQGADVVIHDTDAASFGVFQAVKEAVDGGNTVWAMGMNNDQNDVAPEVTLGSAVIRIPQAFLEVAREWQAGKLGGKPVYSGMPQGVTDYVPNPAAMSRYKKGVLDRVEEARKGILSGAIKVPRVPFVDGETGGA